MSSPTLPILALFSWKKSSNENLLAFPSGAQKLNGDELQLIQFGGMPKDAKLFRGSKGACKK